MGLGTSVRHNLSNLARFSGRDTRALFWPYAALIAGLLYLGSILAALSVFASWWPDFQELAAQHPENVTEQSGPGSYAVEIHDLPPGLIPNMTLIILPMVILSVGAILLLAAAVARRLHDRGRSGWWGKLPLPFLAAGYLLMPFLVSRFTQHAFDENLIVLLFANNAVYIAALIYLVVQLASAGTAGDNRYGPDPLIL